MKGSPRGIVRCSIFGNPSVGNIPATEITIDFSTPTPRQTVELSTCTVSTSTSTVVSTERKFTVIVDGNSVKITPSCESY